jgi:hypothetical protein
MHGRRVLLVSVLISGISIAALALPLVLHSLEQREARLLAEPSPIVAPIDTQREIARQLVLELTGTPARPGPASVVLLSSTLVFCTAEVSKIRPACPPEHHQEYIASVDLDAELPRQLRRELIAANLSSTTVPDPRAPSAIYRARESLSDVLSGAEARAKFKAEFPDADGYLELSRVVLSDDGRHALVYAAFHCGPLCGHGSLKYFVRTPEGWRIAKRVGIWVS